MNSVFKDIPIGGYFIDRYRRLAQKTSDRCARYEASKVYHRRRSELAIYVPRGIDDPYMGTFRKEIEE